MNNDARFVRHHDLAATRPAAKLTAVRPYMLSPSSSKSEPACHANCAVYLVRGHNFARRWSTG